MKKLVALHNLGCKVNAYEAEAMRQMLLDSGYKIVPFGEKADIYIINTCTVTNVADRKSRQMLHKAKKMNPQSVVIATGCYVQAQAEELNEDSAVDIIIGNNKKRELLSVIEDYFANNAKQLSVLDIGETKEYENLSINSSGEHTRAYVKVQDGCNQFCAYCIIPYMRGRVRSRSVKDVVVECTRLAKAGYKEVVLTGINLSSYGTERDEKNGLITLIEAVQQIEDIKRIRLGSLEPRIITEEFVASLAKIEKVCPHFHLSLQSGCDATLERMNRRYNTKEFAEKCALLRKYYEMPAFTTDIIVGFPGESEQEFEETKAFLSEIDFYEMHVFKYSPRKGTKAASMPDQVIETVKSKRSKEVQSIEAMSKQSFMTAMLGKACEVLVEEKIMIDGEEYYIGYTKEYLRIAFKNVSDQVGEIVTVTAKRLTNTDYILGEIPCVL